MNASMVSLSLVVASVFLLVPRNTLAGESLTYDPETGIYTMEYYNTYDQSTPVQRRVQFELRTRIEPTVRSKVSNTTGDPLVYRYEVKSGTNSKQNIVVIRLVGTQSLASKISVPNDWRGNTRPSYVASGPIAGWSYWKDDAGGLKPGAAQPGFGFESIDLPGIGIIESIGNESRDLGGFPDLGPSADTAVGRQYAELMRANLSVRRFAAAPIVVVPNPFNTATVLTGIQQHLRDDLGPYQLVDPVFASQLDQLLQAAIDAAGRGNTAGLKANLKDLRQMLKKEHGDVDKHDDYAESEPDKAKNRPVLIDKLAAKVLDFDFKYVEKRLK